ncbi:MAG: prepilin-type N-terminal cleavage/methylation domain-containing protein [Chloroflexi bacterium]|nr:prepilin-type N-terminal cleavage/methylation domain-containing protein [Chloroflexota bacterium]
MRNENGFTLVELFIVLGIVAVLVGVVAMSFRDVPVAPDDPAAVAELEVVRTAVDAYNTFDVAEGAPEIPARPEPAVIAPDDSDAPFGSYLKEPTTYAYTWDAAGAALAQP